MLIFKITISTAKLWVNFIKLFWIVNYDNGIFFLDYRSSSKTVDQFYKTFSTVNDDISCLVSSFRVNMFIPYSQNKEILNVFDLEKHASLFCKNFNAEMLAKIV